MNVTFPADCAWCGEPATEVVPDKLSENRSAPACPTCARLIAPRSIPAQAEEVAVENRTEPLCSSCYAEITWITLVKDGREGKRMPVDRGPITPSELKRSMVVVNRKTGRGVVLTDALVQSGEAKRWVAAGAAVYLSHFVSCASAKRHRSQKVAA